VAVVNPTKDAVQVKLSLGSVKPTGKAQTWVIAGDDPMACNQPGEPRKVNIQDAGTTDLTGVVSIKPLSITLWRVAVQ
jgi:alpha-L-arabinofuranosidase